MVKTACSCAALVHVYWTAQRYATEGNEHYNHDSENSDLALLLVCVVTIFQNFGYVCSKESQNMYANMRPEVLKYALQAGKCVVKPG
jgi:hypothetical protein